MNTDTKTDPGEMDTQAVCVSKKTVWAGRIMSALPALFLLVDGAMKLAKPQVVVQTTVQLGFPESVIMPLHPSAGRLKFREPPPPASLSWRMATKVQ